MEQSFDVDSQQTVVTLRLQSLEARWRPPPSPLNIDMSAAMSDLRVSTGLYTVNPPQDQTKCRQGFGERIAKACDPCLLGGKPKVNKQGIITTFVPVGQVCTVNEDGKGCKRCSEHQLLCMATNIEILRNHETVRAFLAPPIWVLDAVLVKFDRASASRRKQSLPYHREMSQRQTPSQWRRELCKLRNQRKQAVVDQSIAMITFSRGTIPGANMFVTDPCSLGLLQNEQNVPVRRICHRGSIDKRP